MNIKRITLTDLQNGAPKGRRPGEKNYSPAAGTKASRCENWNCSKFLGGETKGHYRIVDDRTILLCDECLKIYDSKKTGGKMIEIQEDEVIVCAEPGCDNQIKKGAVFYLVETRNGEARGICAECRMKKMSDLENEFAAKKTERDEAQERLRSVTADLSRLSSAKKEIAG